jgi:spore maturation protein SpmA
MTIHYSSDSSVTNIFIQKTYGKLLVVFELMLISALQFDPVAKHFYGQAACLVVGMVLIKLAHRATQIGIGRARQMESAIRQKNRAEDAHQHKIFRVLRRAAVARVVAQACGLWSALKANIAAELQVRSIVKSVLSTVTDTLTPRLFPCPPSARA